MNKSVIPQWLGKPVLEDGHLNDLETRAAVNEFQHKMPRAEAEAKAHEEYVKEQRQRAAAHHLEGMRVSSASGNKEDAYKHWLMYDMHCKALGLESVGPVPPEVNKHLESPDRKASYKFKAHKADLYALQDQESQEPKAEALGKKEGPMGETIPEDSDCTCGYYRALSVTPKEHWRNLSHKPHCADAKRAHPKARYLRVVKSESPLEKAEAEYEALRKSIPDTDYGYWLSPKGEWHPVGMMQHAPVAVQILRDKFGEDPGRQYNEWDIYNRMMDKGYVRLVDAGGQGLSVETGKPLNDYQVANLSALTRSRGHSQVVIEGTDTQSGKKLFGQTFENENWGRIRNSVHLQFSRAPAPRTSGLKAPPASVKEGAVEGRVLPAVPVKSWETPVPKKPTIPGRKKMAKAESGGRVCQWKLGERRCKLPGSRQVGDRWFCHHHQDHWANKITQKSEFEPGEVLGFLGKAVAEVLEPLKKALPALQPPAAPVKEQPKLHGDLAGFMTGLKALPKGSPERGKFITQHMNHPPFLAALKAHPQGPQLHQQLTTFLNSPQNAGFKPGAAKAVAKSESPYSTFDYETWTWNPATPDEVEEIKKADAVRYPEPVSDEVRLTQVEFVEKDGKKYVIVPERPAPTTVSDDTRAWIRKQQYPERQD